MASQDGKTLIIMIFIEFSGYRQSISVATTLVSRSRDTQYPLARKPAHRHGSIAATKLLDNRLS